MAGRRRPFVQAVRENVLVRGLMDLLKRIPESFRSGDKILLLLCVITNAFGMLIIASTTHARGSARYLLIQGFAAAVGILLYLIISSVDAQFWSEHRIAMTVFTVFLLLLLLPFGTDKSTGNRSWLDIPLLPIDIQPAEICKITFIAIMASVMSSHQNRISSIPSVGHAAVYLVLIAGTNMIVSRDAGVSLIFVFIFIGMALGAGINWIWFAIAGGGIVAGFPILWSFLTEYQKKRLLVLVDPSLDPLGVDARYHTVRSLRSLTGGGFTGQGLFNGTRTQTNNALFAQHTDYIFSAIGEELGFLGCAAVLVLLTLVIIRCIWVGNRSHDYMRRLLCFGAAAALIFQVISNVGMCIGVTPVIGLTLPFISYGGSSLMSLYAMLGFVSGVYARPSPTFHQLYIRPY